MTAALKVIEDELNRHFVAEEKVLFPMASRLMTVEEKTAIAAELKAYKSEQ